MPDNHIFLNDYISSNSCDQSTNPSDPLLPKGVSRLTEEAIVAERLEEDLDRSMEKGKVTIAAFDFDGTCISGSSPRKLVSILAKKRQISPYKLFRVMLWGAAYKMNLPKNAEGVRERVFSSFQGKPAKLVNKFLRCFYRHEVDSLFRVDADASMRAHLEQGHVVVLVSASFEPIVAAAMGSHPIQIAIASRMKIDSNGNYTDKVDGVPTEGNDKIEVLKDFANSYFGEGMWELGWSYADHYSDLTMLSAAKHPCAVTPDSALEVYAKQHGWAILDWD